MAEVLVALVIGQSVFVGGAVAEFGHLVVFGRVAGRNRADHLVPFAVELFVVSFSKLFNLVVGIKGHRGVDEAAGLVVALGIEELSVHLTGGVNGIAQHLEEGRALLRCKVALYHVVGFADGLVV